MKREMLHEKEVSMQQHKGGKEYSDQIRDFFQMRTLWIVMVSYLDVHSFPSLPQNCCGGKPSGPYRYYILRLWSCEM
jgi:hypothetical protein